MRETGEEGKKWEDEEEGEWSKGNRVREEREG